MIMPCFCIPAPLSMRYGYVHASSQTDYDSRDGRQPPAVRAQVCARYLRPFAGSGRRCGAQKQQAKVLRFLVQTFL